MLIKNKSASEIVYSGFLRIEHFPKGHSNVCFFTKDGAYAENGKYGLYSVTVGSKGVTSMSADVSYIKTRTEPLDYNSPEAKGFLKVIADRDPMKIKLIKDPFK